VISKTEKNLINSRKTPACAEYRTIICLLSEQL